MVRLVFVSRKPRITEYSVQLQFKITSFFILDPLRGFYDVVPSKWASKVPTSSAGDI